MDTNNISHFIEVIRVLKKFRFFSRLLNIFFHRETGPLRVGLLHFFIEGRIQASLPGTVVSLSPSLFVTIESSVLATDRESAFLAVVNVDIEDEWDTETDTYSDYGSISK